MASGITRQACVKCEKGLGIITCGGCQQWLCTKHFIEHRQELAIRIDNIGQEHDLFRRDVIQPTIDHPLLTRVNQWEQQSIDRIKGAAEEVRTNLQQYLINTKGQIKTSLDQLTNDLQSSRNTDDYTEIELDKWIKQLQEFREALEKPTDLEIVGDEEQTESIIRLIELTRKQTNCKYSLLKCGLLPDSTISSFFMLIEFSDSDDQNQPDRLKVEDAANDDNSVVGLSQEKMDELKMFRGDTVFIKGNKNHETVCIVLADDTCQNECVRMNQVVQNNVGVRSNDFVSIRRCQDIQYAERVRIKATNNNIWKNHSNLLDAYLRPYFVEVYRPVRKGDTFIVRANREPIEFQVIETDPDPYCIVAPDTIIMCDGQTRPTKIKRKC